MQINGLVLPYRCKWWSFSIRPFSLSLARCFYDIIFILCGNVFHLCDTCQVVTCICYCVMCMHTKYSPLTGYDASRCNWWLVFTIVVRIRYELYLFHGINDQTVASVRLIYMMGEKYLINMHHSCCLTLSRAIVACVFSLLLTILFQFMFLFLICSEEWLKCILSLFLSSICCSQRVFYSVFALHRYTINSEFERWHTK